ncbi:MAG TPA: phosphoglycerate mutase family protein, partial [Flavisolibacter sp.]|nr:phosphoglycerate mutase family protein [Flavisolibacter sp.]
MVKYFCYVMVLLCISCKTTTIYVVRHAEKESASAMSGDVPLSAAGQQRAEALKDMLINKNISGIYTTNYIRTRNTAKPLADALGLTMITYNPGDTSFTSKIRDHLIGNLLIVGHS